MLTGQGAKIIETAIATISTAGVGGIIIYAIIFKALSKHLRQILEFFGFLAILSWIGVLKL